MIKMPQLSLRRLLLRAGAFAAGFAAPLAFALLLAFAFGFAGVPAAPPLHLSLGFLYKPASVHIKVLAGLPGA